jgi:hypothetical protein
VNDRHEQCPARWGPRQCCREAGHVGPHDGGPDIDAPERITALEAANTRITDLETELATLRARVVP